MPQHDDVLKMLGLDSAPVPRARPRNPRVDLSPPPIQQPQPIAQVQPQPQPQVPSELGSLWEELRGTQGPQSELTGLWDELRGVDRGQTLPPPQQVSEIAEASGGQWPGAAVMRGFNVSQAGVEAAAGAALGRPPEETAARVATQMRDIESWMDPEYARKQQEWAETEEGWPAFKFMMTNPSFMASVVGEGFGTMAGGAIAGGAAGAAGGRVAGPRGALAGLAGGVGLSSGAVEGGMKIIETIKDAGFDPTDDEQLAAAFADDKLMEEAVDKAIKKGVAVGSIDAISTMVGGPLFLAARRAMMRAGVRPGRATVAAGAGGVVFEGATEGAGEAVGELASEGVIPWKDVMLEAAAGAFAGGALELTQSVARARDLGEGTPSTEEDVPRMGGAVEEPPVPSFEETLAEGRTEFGFAREGESFVRVGPDYEAATLEGQTTGERKGRLVAVDPTQEKSGVSVEQFRTKIMGAPAADRLRAVETFATLFQGTPEQKESMADRLAALAFATRDELGMLRGVRQEYNKLLEEGVTIDLERAQRMGFVPDLVRAEEARPSQFREPDRAFVTFSEGTIKPGAVVLERLGSSQGLDLDLRRVQSGDIQPDNVINLHKIAQAFDNQTVIDLAIEGGSTPEALHNLQTHLGPYLISGVHQRVQRQLDSGELKLRPDSRWTQFGIRVASDVEAAARVEAAAIEGLYKKGDFSGTEPKITGAWKAEADVRPVKSESEVKATVVHAEQHHELIKRLTETAQKVMRELKIPYALNVYGMSDRPGLMATKFEDFRPGASSGGYFRVHSVDTSTVVINTNQVAGHIVTTFWHEFGHFIMFTGLARRNNKEWARLYAAYERYLLSTGLVEELAQSFAYRTNAYPKGQGTKNEYFMTFEEWFAEQMGRWGTSNKQTRHWLPKIAKDLARQLLKAWKGFRDADLVNEARPEAVIEDFVRAVHAERDQLQWSDVIDRANGRITLQENMDKLEVAANSLPTGITVKLTPAERKYLEATVGDLVDEVPGAQLESGFLTIPKGDESLNALMQFVDESRIRREGRNAIPPSFFNEGFVNKFVVNETIATPMPPEGLPLHEVANALPGFKPTPGQANPVSLPRLAAENDRFNWFYKFALGLVQLAKLNPHVLNLQVYRELNETAEVEMREIMVRAKDVLTDWNGLGHTQAEKLGAFLLDLTTWENWPAIVGNPQQRQRAQQEQRRIVNELRVKHKVSQEGMQVFSQIMDIFNQDLTRMHDLALTEAAKITDVGKKAEAIKSINAEFARMRSKPYFPLIRYGKWTVTVRQEGKVVHFEAFESKRQRDRAAKLLQGEHGNESVGLGVMDDFTRSLSWAPPSFLDMLERTLQLTPEQAKELQSLKYDLAPAQSFKKRFMLRNKKAIAGFSDDARRGFAHYHTHHAKHYVRAKYGQQMRDAISGLRETARTAQKTGVQPDVTNLLEIANYMQDHLDNVFMFHKPDMAWLRSAAAHWYLGFNPKSALLNLTQIGFGTLPFLGSKFGDVKAMNGIRKAATDVRLFYRKETIAGLNDADMKALTIAFGEGFINESQAAELAATAEGPGMLGNVARGAIHEKWGQLNELSMMLFQLSESFNRKVTFIAARRLAMENPGARWLNDLRRRHPLQFRKLINEHGMSELDALAFLAGKDSVIETQYNYSRVMRPRYMRGRLGALFQFHMFVQSTMFMIGSNRGVLPRYLLVMAGVGGLMGFPGAEDASDIIRFIAGRMFGKEFDIEQEINQYVRDVTHEDFPFDVVSRGVSRYGFGIPWIAEMAGMSSWPKFDMSASVGMGQIAPVNPFTAIADPGADTERMIAQSAENISGAAFGMGFRVAEAVMDTMNYGFDMRTWTRAMPSSMQNVIKAGRYAWEGAERDRGGGLITKFDTRDPEHLMEIGAQAFGFRPTRVAQAWDRRIAEIKKEQYWDWRRRFLFKAMQNAVEQRDREEIAQVRKRIQAFNREVPRGKAISSQGLRRSIEMQREKVERTERGLPRTRGATGIFEEVKRMFPDAVSVTRPRDLERGPSQ